MVLGAIRIPMLTAQSAAQASRPVNVRSYTNFTFYLLGTGTTSSGVITIEEADSDENQVFSGTWSTVGTPTNASTLSGGVQIAVHLTAGAYSYLRARISTVIGGGGTITAVLRAN